jgi:hypothetical protein
MSGSSDEAPGSLVEADKVDVRRFCGYPAYGAGASGFQGWRFFQAYGLLEYRLNNMAPEEVTIVQQYLTNLRQLEAAVPAAGANLATAVAGPWTHNKLELRDRTVLFDSWRTRLCGFMGVPVGPQFLNGGGSIVI